MLKLARYDKNPIISPRSGVWWESGAVFNPAVINDNGKIHMLYRALGGDRISRFGYAYSTDGYNFKGFSDVPVFESDPFDSYERLGCEDPRITRIGDTYYIVYCSASVHPATFPRSQFSTSFAPWRVRVSMISTKDFSTYHRQGVVIHSVDSKDAALFPEMIDGQYVILHRIWIAYSQDLENWYDHRILLKTRKNSWDSGKIGAGSPPIKTEHGWLLFYHGTDHQNIYRLGIILLDLDDPTKVLYRSEEPVLEPEKPYEKEGLVPNVVFTCGVVEKDDKFFVYYGAADRCIGVATIERERLFYEIAKRMHGEMVHG